MSDAMVEQELTVRADQIELGDYLYVGHMWWGEVKRISTRLGVVFVNAGGMEYPLAIPVDDQNVTIRRAHNPRPDSPDPAEVSR